MNQNTTGSIIKELREKKNLTQAELAELLLISDKTISKWETGGGYPDITMLEPLVKILGVSVAELFAGEPVENTNTSANMLRSKFYVCPECGNILHTMGEAVIHCHGRQLRALTAKLVEEGHLPKIEIIEDEYYVTIDHKMTKNEYISFIAGVSADKIQIEKLYPEGPAEARFKIGGVQKIYYYCSVHGLFCFDVYARRAKDSWGDTLEYKESAEKSAKRTEDEEISISEDFMNIFKEFGEMKHLNPDSDEAKVQVKKLQDFITAHYYNCTTEILLSLGGMYSADGEFKDNIDKAGGSGTAEFTSTAIEEYCKKCVK